jgi:hypothetical protein
VLSFLNYPYDDSTTAASDLLTRCSAHDYASFDGKPLNNGFSLFHLNIRSALKKFDEFCVWLCNLSHKPSVLCFTETWYDVNMPPGMLNGYNVVNIPRALQAGGGVCMYIQSQYTFITHSFNSYTTFEHCIITLNSPRPTCIALDYRPPSSSLPIFLEEIDDLLASIAKQFPNFDIFLTGDFNIDLLALDNNNSLNFSNLLSVYNLYPSIFLPTRVSSSSSTLIDNTFTNISYPWTSGVVDCYLSDHYN